MALAVGRVRIGCDPDSAEGTDMRQEDSWSGTVLKKSRGLLDGSNLYRRLTIRTDDGRTERIRVGRAFWKELRVGDHVVKDVGEDPRRT
jgi:hypothetical protein